MSWLNDALSWVRDQAEGVSNWFADQVGDVWDGVGSTFGFETEAQKLRREQTESATEAWNQKRQELADSFNRYKNEWAGSSGTAKAYNMAKESTGAITSGLVEGAARESQNAQRSVGINKSQAALSASNAVGQNYTDSYDVDTQADKLNSQIQAEVEANEKAYNAEDALMQGQYQGELADIARKKNSDLGLGASVNLGDIWGQYTDRSRITSDENEKGGLLPVNADTCALHLMMVLKDFEIKTPEDYQLLIMALQFLDLWSKRRCCNQKEKE